MTFLALENKNFLITGVANKKSIAYAVAKGLEDAGAKLYLSLQSEDHFSKVSPLFPHAEFVICNVENQPDIDNLGVYFATKNIILHGLLHSIAFANYSQGMLAFHETSWDNYQQALKISQFSLMALSNTLKCVFHPQASVVTLSISNTRATNYGMLGPIKAALDSSVAFLAKSFSNFSQVRFNAVCAGPLKTSASAGIPGYVDNYLFAEKLTLRKKALATQEVADVALFLLSNKSSGINAASVVVDAGMAVNYFDQEVVSAVAKDL